MGKVNIVQRRNSQMKSESTKENLIQVAIQSDTKPALPQQKQISILVVDDDAFYFCFIEIILIPLNYKVFHAKNGQEAVNIFQSNKEDIKLILMDIQMPVMDGLTATKKIRKIDSEIPIIAQTSCRIIEFKKKAITSGCNEILLKPVDPEVLSMKIENYLKLTDKNLIH